MGNDAELTVPRGACDKTLNFSVTHLDTANFIQTEEPPITNAHIAPDLLELGPAGTKFKRPVQIRMRPQLPENCDPKSVNIYCVKKKVNKIFAAGDRCRYFSEDHEEWFEDGVVIQKTLRPIWNESEGCTILPGSCRVQFNCGKDRTWVSPGKIGTEVQHKHIYSWEKCLNSHFSPETGYVTAETTHFSMFAVVFSDLEASWERVPIKMSDGPAMVYSEGGGHQLRPTWQKIHHGINFEAACHNKKCSTTHRKMYIPLNPGEKNLQLGRKVDIIKAVKDRKCPVCSSPLSDEYFKCMVVYNCKFKWEGTVDDGYAVGAETLNGIIDYAGDTESAHRSSISQTKEWRQLHITPLKIGSRQVCEFNRGDKAMAFHPKTKVWQNCSILRAEDGYYDVQFKEGCYRNVLTIRPSGSRKPSDSAPNSEKGDVCRPEGKLKLLYRSRSDTGSTVGRPKAVLGCVSPSTVTSGEQLRKERPAVERDNTPPASRGLPSIPAKSPPPKSVSVTPPPMSKSRSAGAISAKTITGISSATRTISPAKTISPPPGREGFVKSLSPSTTGSQTRDSPNMLKSSRDSPTSLGTQTRSITRYRSNHSSTSVGSADTLTKIMEFRVETPPPSNTASTSRPPTERDDFEDGMGKNFVSVRAADKKSVRKMHKDAKARRHAEKKSSIDLPKTPGVIKEHESYHSASSVRPTIADQTVYSIFATDTKSKANRGLSISSISSSVVRQLKADVDKVNMELEDLGIDDIMNLDQKSIDIPDFGKFSQMPRQSSIYHKNTPKGLDKLMTFPELPEEAETLEYKDGLRGGSPTTVHKRTTSPMPPSRSRRKYNASPASHYSSDPYKSDTGGDTSDAERVKSPMPKRSASRNSFDTKTVSASGSGSAGRATPRSKFIAGDDGPQEYRTEKELIVYMQKFGMSETEARVLFRKIDTNGDGLVSWREYRTFVVNNYEVFANHLKQTHPSMIQHHKGEPITTPLQLQNVMKILGEDLSKDDAEKLIHEIDVCPETPRSNISELSGVDKTSPQESVSDVIELDTGFLEYDSCPSQQSVTVYRAKMDGRWKPRTRSGSKDSRGSSRTSKSSGKHHHHRNARDVWNWNSQGSVTIFSPRGKHKLRDNPPSCYNIGDVVYVDTAEGWVGAKVRRIARDTNKYGLRFDDEDTTDESDWSESELKAILPAS